MLRAATALTKWTKLGNTFTTTRLLTKQQIDSDPAVSSRLIQQINTFESELLKQHQNERRALKAYLTIEERSRVQLLYSLVHQLPVEQQEYLLLQLRIRASQQQ